MRSSHGAESAARQACCAQVHPPCACLLADQEVAARSVGTTVSVRELFKPLPVRYKAFQRSVKREYVKLVQVLQAYALVAPACRLLVTNQVPASRSLRAQQHVRGLHGYQLPWRLLCSPRIVSCMSCLVPRLCAHTYSAAE